MNSIWQTAEYRELIGRRKASISNYEPITNAIALDGSSSTTDLVFQDGYQFPTLSFGGLPFNHVFDTFYNTKTHVKYVTTIGATTYTLDDSVIKQLSYTEKSVSGSQFSFGDFIGRLADFTLYDTDGTYDTVSFEGASGHLYFGVEKVDTSIFWIDYGTFIVDDCKRTAATIWFALKDKRYLFNATMATISTNKTLYQMAQEVCSQAVVTLGTESADLPNASITITNTTALQNKTLSQLVSAIAQATGTYAIIGKDDKLYFRWYEEVSPVCAIPANLVNASMTVADYEVSVTGLTWLDFNGVSYSSGTSTYSIKVAGNPFEFANYNTVLSGIATNVIGTSYTPISMQYVGNPALEIGDIVIASDKHGNTYSLPITSISIRNLMSQSIKSTGESHISNASNTTSASTTIETAKNEAIAFAKYCEVEADRIKTGIVKSTDGKTYFNLDNDEIFMDGGANGKVKINPTVGIQMLDNTDVQIGGTASIGGLLASIAQIITNDPTDPECWATIGYSHPYHGIFVFRKSISTTVPVLRILLGTGGDFYLQNSSGVNIFDYQGAGLATILRDSAGKLRFYADADTTRLCDSAEKLRFYADAETTRLCDSSGASRFYACESDSRLYSPDNLNFVYVDNTNVYKSINGIVTTI